MGQVFASLFSKKPACDIYVDIENAKPSEREEKTYGEVKEVLVDNEKVMKLIVDYKGCQKLCQQAMQEPSPETERAAFEGLLKTIDSIQKIHLHSKALGDAAKLLLQALGRDDTKQTLEDQQALVKQFGDMLVFVVDFDQKRLECPQLSNDFAFYRRLLPKFPKHPDLKVKAEEASSMALFTAKSFPMISALSSATSECMDSNDQVLPMIGTMANACYNMLSKKRYSLFQSVEVSENWYAWYSFEKGETNLFLAKAMTGAIVLYDNVSDSGVFVRSSHVQVTGIFVKLRPGF